MVADEQASGESRAEGNLERGTEADDPDGGDYREAKCHFTGQGALDEPRML